MAIGSSVGATVGSEGTAVGSTGAVVGSAAGASVAEPPQAASTKLAITSTNNNERTVLVISIFLLVFGTLKSYQPAFKGMRRTG
jgi:hypothetical protein